MRYVLGLIALVTVATAAQAATINYGDFPADDVTFIQVTESDIIGGPAPLFGTPTVSGNTLDFDPVTFIASSSLASPPVDTTSGLVEFDIESHAGSFMNTLSFFESGSATLAGVGTDLGTTTSVTADVTIDIEEVDGGSFPGGPINVVEALTFGPSGGSYVLSDGPVVRWSGVANVDVAAILAANNVSFNGGATKVTVTLTNTLIATSEDGTQTSISKADADTRISVNGIIPEPVSISMVLMASAFSLACRRSRD